MKWKTLTQIIYKKNIENPFLLGWIVKVDLYEYKWSKNIIDWSEKIGRYNQTIESLLKYSGYNKSHYIYVIPISYLYHFNWISVTEDEKQWILASCGELDLAYKNVV